MKKVDFGAVLAALKKGQKAQREGWITANMFLIPNIQRQQVIGMLFETNGIKSAAGLHNLDLLADDWIIIE